MTNKTFICGNLTNDATFRDFGDKKTMNCTVAVSLPGKEGYESHYFNVTQVVSAERAATLAESLTKGTSAFVTGRLNRRTFNRQDGTTGAVTEVNAARILPSKDGRLPAISEAVLEGRLSRDPERHGSIVTTSLCVQGPYQKDAEKQPVFYVEVVCFGYIADAMEKYYKKGDSVTLAGTMQNPSYTKNDGQKATTPKLLVNDFPSRHRSAQNAASEDANSDAAASAPVGADDYNPMTTEDDEIPF